MASPTIVQLNYGPPSKRRRWRRLGVFSTLAALAFVCYRFGPGAWRHGQVMLRDYRCLTYTMPADFVVYEEDPDVSSKLLKSNSGYQHTASLLDPPEYVQYVIFEPPAWAAHPCNGSTQAVAFLHRRHTPGGVTRLVAVTVYCDEYQQSGRKRTLVFGARVMAPASRTKDPILIMRDDYPLNMAAEDGGTVRIFAGQPDAADPSHFTIRFEMNGRPGTIDGWRRDNDRMVELRPRGGRYVHYAARLDAAWCPDGSKRPPSLLDTPADP